MFKLNERGFAHLLLLLLLGAGLIVGVYLVTSDSPLKLFSRASMSRPVGPETSFSLAGPGACSGLACLLPGNPQPQEEFVVKLFARSDMEASNLFEAKMVFPKDLVEVKEIKTEGSIVHNWIENFYDNENGEINLAGGVTAPGYQTQTGEESGFVAAIVFQAKALGKGTVSFTDSSAVYSNLNNINILTVKRPYDISVEVKPSPTIEPKPTPISCKVGVNSFAVTDACSVTNFRYADYVCYNGDKGRVGDGSCQTSATLQKLADEACANSWSCPTLSPVPAPTCKPRPICLDTNPACVIIEPQEGWCPAPSPAPGAKGDGNKDGKINLVDMSVLHTDYRKTSDMANFREGVDMNTDELINAFDFSALKQLLQKLGVVKVR